MRLGKGDFISLQMLGGLDYWGQAATNDFILLAQAHHSHQTSRK
jgi:hypothetical protein